MLIAVGTLLGGLITLLGVYVAYRIGWIQVTIMRREQALNLARTLPKIGTSVCFEDRKNPNHPVSTLVIITSIYNEGELAASQLTGNWNLSCSKIGFNRSIPISVDHLGQARPHKMETPFGDVGTWRAVRGGENITINVDLEIRYSRPTEQGEEEEYTYYAKYQYDPTQRDFVRVRI
jgi:hypothetical protein